MFLFVIGLLKLLSLLSLFRYSKPYYASLCLLELSKPSPTGRVGWGFRICASWS